MTMATTGTKFERGMDTAEAAKRIRADIKRAQKEGKLPTTLKASVRISRFSGGSSVDVTIQAAPVQIHTSEYIAHHVATKGHVCFEGHRYTKSAQALLEAVEAIGDEYRRVDSDLLSDYYSANFYLSVKFSTDLEREDRAILTEYHEALSAPRLRLVGT